MSFNSDKFNESFNLLESREYKNYIIIDTNSGIHIRDSKGNFIVEVPTDDEATEFIDGIIKDNSDNKLEDKKDKFTVFYVTSTELIGEETVDARNEQEAKDIVLEKIPNIKYFSGVIRTN